MSVLKHTHSYIRHSDRKRRPYLDKSGDIVYKCSDPRCSYRVKKIDIIGKATLCPGCQIKEFVLTPEDLRRAKPLCMDCRDTAESRQHNRIKDILAGAADKAALKEAREELSGGAE